VEVVWIGSAFNVARHCWTMGRHSSVPVLHRYSYVCRIKQVASHTGHKMSLIELRPYQFTAVKNLRDSYGRGNKAPLLVMPTAAGKTIVFSYITQGTAAKRKRVLIIAHRRELITQASRKLSEAGVEHGIIAPGFTATRDSVQVASIQTISRKPEAFGAFDLIIIDEGHHSVAGQYARLIAAQPTAKLLGVTATPERADGRGLGV
jgi:DNA repair protein RadD